MPNASFMADLKHSKKKNTASNVYKVGVVRKMNQHPLTPVALKKILKSFQIIYTQEAYFLARKPRMLEETDSSLACDG